MENLIAMLIGLGIAGGLVIIIFLGSGHSHK